MKYLLPDWHGKISPLEKKNTLLGIETFSQQPLWWHHWLYCVPPNLHQQGDNYSHYTLNLAMTIQNKAGEKDNNTALLAKHFPSF